MPARLDPVALLGAGAVAGALGEALVRAGLSVGVWARDPARSRRLARRLGARALARLPDPRETRTLVLAVSDGALEDVARRAARAGPAAPGAVALHTSGYLDEGALAALAAVGWSTGTLHPLVSLPARAGAAALEGAYFAVSGVAPARRRARALLTSMGGRVLRLRPGARVRGRYHAAAALLAGGGAALFDAALELFGETGPGEREARAALARLLRSVLENVERAGPRAALTGPAARGDLDVVAGHLACMPRATAELYRALALRAAQMARARGTLSERRLRALRRALGRA